MKKAFYIAIPLAMLLILPGCWNSKDIQSMAYATSIGFDYVDGKFKSYVQILNFKNVARGESSDTGVSVPIWVGSGEGDTITESLSNIYATAQRRIFWGHVKSIVFSESMLKQGIKDVFDTLNRLGEVRYNVLLYGTKEPMINVMIQKSILNFSPLETVMDSPRQVYTQRSFILPVFGYHVISEMNEADGSVMLPSLSINKDSWHEDKDSRPIFKVNGAYFLQSQEYRGFLSEEDLNGKRWTQRQLQRSPINIPMEGRPQASLILIKPRLTIDPYIIDNKTRFHIRVSIQTYVDELRKNLTQQEIEKEASKVVKQEILTTYRKGLAIGADVFELDDRLYRKYPKKWKELHKNKPFILDEKSLAKVDVRIQMTSSGKYKLRVQ